MEIDELSADDRSTGDFGRRLAKMFAVDAIAPDDISALLWMLDQADITNARSPRAAG
jgi:hypothetical protein